MAKCFEAIVVVFTLGDVVKEPGFFDEMEFHILGFDAVGEAVLPPDLCPASAQTLSDFQAIEEVRAKAHVHTLEDVYH
ncbi:MAG: hypothetical protein AAF662_10905 [Pseudomonadota bacterium]